MTQYKFWEQEHSTRYSSRNAKVNYFPQKVMFELTSRCNLSCWHCDKSTTTYNGQDTSKEIIDYVHQKILVNSKYLRIGGMGIGEPLLSKNFDYFFSNFKRNNLQETHLVTNLTLLDDEKANIIVKEIDNLEISLEGTGEQYSRIRHFPWETILKNIRLLAKYREINKNSSLKITLLVCTLLNNLESLIGLFDLKNIGVDKIVFREFIPCIKDKDIECLWQKPKKIIDFIERCENKSKESGIPIEIDFKDKYDRAKQQNQRTKAILELEKCYFPWTCIAVDSLGNISGCCFPLELARLQTCKEELFDVWNNEQFSSLRKTVNSRQPWLSCLQCGLRTAHLTDEEKFNFIDKHSNI